MNFIHLIEWSETKIISFDFDDTLCTDGKANKGIISRVFKHHADGDECIIVTARDPDHEKDDWIKENEPKRTKVIDFVKRHNLPITKIIYTNHKPKGIYLKRNNVFVHFDDKQEEINSAKKYGVHAIKVENDKWNE